MYYPNPRTITIRIRIDNVDNVDTELMHNETRDVKRVRTALKPNIDEVPKFVLRFIAFDTRLHYIISEYWRTGRRRGGNNQNFVPPPVEADTNEDDWGVFSKVERVYICIFNQSLSLFLSLSLYVLGFRV